MSDSQQVKVQYYKGLQRIWWLRALNYFNLQILKPNSFVLLLYKISVLTAKIKNIDRFLKLFLNYSLNE